MGKSKRMWGYLLLMMTAFSCLGLVSCSSDDEEDNGGNAPAAFEQYAAKYQLSGNDAEFSSVEFTESGNYIITKKNPYGAPVRSSKKNNSHISMLSQGMFKHQVSTRSGEVYSPILYGKYTVDADGTYILEGYGKVKVTQDGEGNAFSLEFMPNGSSSYTYKASKQNRDLNSNNSSRLCKTWNFASCRVLAKVNGKTVLDISANSYMELYKKLDEWSKEHDDEYEPGDWEEDIVEVKQVIFTKTGTYMVKYEGNQLAVSTWKWANTEETLIRYSWNNDFDDDDFSGYAEISYDGGKLALNEKDTESDEDGSYEMNLIAYFNEAK